MWDKQLLWQMRILQNFWLIHYLPGLLFSMAADDEMEGLGSSSNCVLIFRYFLQADFLTKSLMTSRKESIQRNITAPLRRFMGLPINPRRTKRWDYVPSRRASQRWRLIRRTKQFPNFSNRWDRRKRCKQIQNPMQNLKKDGGSGDEQFFGREVWKVKRKRDKIQVNHSIVWLDNGGKTYG